MSIAETINLLKINTDLPKKCGYYELKMDLKNCNVFWVYIKIDENFITFDDTEIEKKNCHKNLIYINNVISIK